MEMFNTPILLMVLAMVLAIGIERLMELMRAVEDHLEARRGDMDKWQKKAERLRDRIEVRLEMAKGTDPTVFQRVLSAVCLYLSPSPQGTPGLIAVSADQVRNMSIRLRYKLIAVLLGIFFAWIFSLDLFELVNHQIHKVDQSALPAVDYSITLPSWLGTILSGVAMGFGAGPVHKLIVALERARQTRR